MQELDETGTAEASDRKPDTEEIRKRIKELGEKEIIKRLREIRVAVLA